MNVVSRKDALSRGLKQYCTGRPCLQGHLAARFVQSRQCVECSRECRRSYVERNPAVKKAKRTPEQLAQHASYMRKRYAANPALVRSGNLARYGLTIEDYQALLKKQGGHCAICPSPIGNSKHISLFVDHCHKTKAVRGLLCHNCNAILGHAKDDPSILRVAADYLEAA